jgi:hypothetical protein
VVVSATTVAASAPIATRAGCRRSRDSALDAARRRADADVAGSTRAARGARTSAGIGARIRALENFATARDAFERGARASRDATRV